jgi:phosphoribosylanthranilate isomerase
MWIKICGIRDVETALAVAACKPDAIGLNFYAGSPRVVTPTTAAEIVARLPAGIEPVGVFVNHSVEQIRDLSRETGLKVVQLHGDEPPETIAALAPLRVIRVFHFGAAGLADAARYLDHCRQLGALPWACLVDSQVGDAYGGTGQTAPWDRLRAEYNRTDWPPLILAGGLRPENVAAAIEAVHPWGVDVASGVESTIACKDPARVRQFVEQCRRMEDGGTRMENRE